MQSCTLGLSPTEKLFFEVVQLVFGGLGLFYLLIFFAVTVTVKENDLTCTSSPWHPARTRPLSHDNAGEQRQLLNTRVYTIALMKKK